MSTGLLLTLLSLYTDDTLWHFQAVLGMAQDSSQDQRKPQAEKKCELGT